MNALAGRSIAVVVSAASLLAACGSSSPHKTVPPKGIFAFATCMQNHGVNFPSPKVSVSGSGDTAVAMVVPSTIGSSPAFKAAQRACGGILPAFAPLSAAALAARRHVREQELLAFARCLRAHGVPKFPDPTSQGQLTLTMVQSAGVDLHAPAVLPAARDCVGVTHGAITLAAAERAINSTP